MKQSLQEYVSDLDLNSLYLLNDLVNNRIESIRSEEKKLLWQVSDKELTYQYFREEEYIEAAMFLLSIAERNQNSPYPSDKVLYLDAIKVPKSEYESYFE